MKSLNKTLSLVLVLVMVLGLFGIAGAAFNDQDKIENTEAVNTMAALNIINGMGDGTFNPAGNVTRAEMAKMICVALNGGKEPVLGTSSTPMFSDIGGHWGQKYIEYCTSLGIIAGMGDGTFAPDAAVTGSQAAKMMLVAMNYNAKVFGFEGANWEVNVNVSANKAGLYKDISVDASAAISRDNAAQLIYNGIDAPNMVRGWSQDPSTGKITETYQLGKADETSIAATKFSLLTGYSYLASVAYDFTNKNYRADLEDPRGGVTTTKNLDTDFSSDTDYSSCVGMNVKVLYKTTSSGISVYGVYPYKSSVVLAGVVGQLSDSDIASAVMGGSTELKFNNTTYKFDTTLAATPVYNVNEATERGGKLETYLGTLLTGGANSILASYSFKAIDLDSDGKIDHIVVYPFSVYKVTYVGSDTASITRVMGEGAALTEIDLEDDVVYSGIAKGDYVKYTAAANTSANAKTFEKINPMTGTVAKTTTAAMGSLVLTKAQMNGIYFVDLTGGNTQTVGTSYENIIQVNTFVFYSDVAATSTTGEDYAVTLTAVKNDTFSSPRVKLIYADGTTKEVSTTNVDGSFLANTLVQFTKSSTDKYTLATATAVPGAYKADIPGGATYAVDSNDVGYITQGGEKYVIADSAIVFVNVTSGVNAGHKIMTGAQLKTLDAATVKAGFYNENSSTGFKTVALVYVDITGTASSSATNYGYITDAVATTRDEDNVTVYEVTFWNGTETVTKTASSITGVDSAKGTIFQYSMDSKDRMVVTAVPDLTLSRVSAFDGTNLQITGATNGAKTSSSTTVFYVNSKDAKGVVGGEIQVGQTSVNNVYYVDAGTADGAFKFIVFDVNNEMETLGSITVAATAADTQAELNALFNAYKTVNVTGVYTMTENITVPANKTLALAGALDVATYILDVNGTLSVGGTIAIGATGTIDFAAAPSAAIMGKLEDVSTAGATVIFGANATSVAANKWYTSLGTASSDGIETDGTPAVAVAITSAIAAGTYKYGTGTAYAGGTDNSGASVAAWLKQ